jgi:hypothetical protein
MFISSRDVNLFWLILCVRNGVFFQYDLAICLVDYSVLATTLDCFQAPCIEQAVQWHESHKLLVGGFVTLLSQRWSFTIRPCNYWPLPLPQRLLGCRHECFQKGDALINVGANLVTLFGSRWMKQVLQCYLLMLQGLSQQVGIAVIVDAEGTESGDVVLKHG